MPKSNLKQREKADRFIPITIDKNTWYYDCPKRLEIVHEIYIQGEYIRTDQFIIKKKKPK